MLFPLESLLRDREEPLCIQQDQRLSTALDLMLKHDYSQLPVVDRQGRLKGIVSEKTIIRSYYHQKAAVSLLDLAVDHCMDTARRMDPEAEVFDALDQFRDVPAIVVVKNDKPYRIFTLSDATLFFRELSEGLMWVQDIEVTLRQYTDVLFDDDKKRTAALMRVFGADKQDPSKPAREYDKLSLGDQIRLLMNKEHWERLEGKLDPKRSFEEYLTQVRDIRNQLAHFRGDLDPVQRDALSEARRWLSTRPKLARPYEAMPTPVHPMIRERPAAYVTGERGKYEPLERYLRESVDVSPVLRLTFDDIGKLLDEPLPPSAREHRAWWANDPDTHPQAAAWARAGWRVDDVDQNVGAVLFRRDTGSLYQVFFADLIEKFKQVRPGLTRSTRTLPQNWCDFGSGRSGFAFSWVFSKGDRFRAELYIDTGDKEQNERVFEALLAQREQIEAEFGSPLEWDKLPLKRACRIYAANQGNIKDSAEQLEQLRAWGVDAMARLTDVLRVRIRELQIS